MEGLPPHPVPRTVEEVFSDYRGRRAGLIKALTTGSFALFSVYIYAYGFLFFFVFFPCFVRILMILLNGCLWVLQKLKSSTSSAILVSYFFWFQGYFDFDFDFYGTCYSFFSLWVFLIASFSLWCFL